MFSATGTLTGIDLGSRTVKLVRARTTKTSGKLLDACVEDLADLSVDSWESESLHALQRLLKSRKLSKGDLGRVSVSVSGPSVHLRQVDLPALTDAELRASMKYEARKHLPLENPTEAAVDCQILSRQDQRMSVLFAGAPESLIQSRVRVLHKAGLEPVLVDPAPLSLLNGLYGQPDMKQSGLGTVAVMDLGGSSATFVMSRKGGVVYSRTVLYPESVSSLKPEDPESVDLFARAVAGAFRETAQFYSTINARRPIEALFIAGGGALLDGIDMKLASLLGIPVSLLDLTKSLNYSPASPGDPAPEVLSRLAPQFAVAAGLLFWGNGNVSD